MGNAGLCGLSGREPPDSDDLPPSAKRRSAGRVGASTLSAFIAPAPMHHLHHDLIELALLGRQVGRFRAAFMALLQTHQAQVGLPGADRCALGRICFFFQARLAGACALGSFAGEDTI